MAESPDSRDQPTPPIAASDGGVAAVGFGDRLRHRWRAALFAGGVIVAFACSLSGIVLRRPEPFLIALAALIGSAIPMLLADLRRKPTAASAATGSKSVAADSALRRVFEVSLDAITVNRLSDGLFVEVNPEFARITGYARHELIGHTVGELALWVTAEDHREYLRRLEAEGSVRNIESIFRHRDGRVVPGVMSSAVVELDGERCVVSVVRDISEWKRTEHELREAHRALSEQVEALRENQLRLHESETKLRKVFDSSLDAIVVRRLSDDTYLDVNHEFVNLTGYSREEVVGHSIDSLRLRPDNIKPFFIKALQTDGFVRNMERVIRRKDGVFVPISESGVLLELDGEPCAVSVVRDITQAKAAEAKLIAAGAELTAQVEALRENQLRLHDSETMVRKVFEASLDTITIQRLSDLAFIDVNPEFERLTGISREQAISKSLEEHALWVDPRRREEFFRLLRAQGFVRDWEENFRIRNGSIEPHLISAVVVELKGVPHAIMAVRDIVHIKRSERALITAQAELTAQVDALRDSQVRLRTEIEQRERIIAEREQIDKQLRESEIKLRKVFDTSLDAISIRRLRDDCYLDANREFLSLTGYRRDEVIGHTLDELKLRADDLKPTLVEALQSKGFVRNMEGMLRRNDGSLVPIMTSGVLLELDGERCIVAITRDITQLKKAEADLIAAREAALAASEAKSEFLSSMSHEIRTPMNAILGMAQLLWETPLSLYQRRYLETMRANGDALLALIDDILDLAKVESGQLVLENVAFELDELVERAVETLGIRAHQKGLELAARIAPDVPLGVTGDPLRLRQILINLLGNAIKFTSRGEVLLTVERDCAPPQPAVPAQASTWLRFSISDTGIGIAPEKLATIFSSFTQADSSVARQFGGTGLGLAIVKRLVEFYGGQIKVESRIDAGSSFSFTIPVAVRTLQAPKDPALEAALAGRRILVVDDTELNRRVVRELLAPYGASTDEADRADAAFILIEQARSAAKPYDLVLLDVRVPGASAFDFVTRMKPATLRDVSQAAHNGPTADAEQTPERVVLMLASNDLAAGLEEMRELGLDHYLVKPIRRRDLLETASRALGPRPPSLTATAASPAQAGNLAPAVALKILLVEDSSDNRMLIEAYLKGGNYQIDEAENGQSAIAKFMASKYDLVLMDIQMPIVDGYMAVRAIREWEAKQNLARTPIIALTASAMNEAVSRSLEVGCDSHVSKPVKRATLLAAIREATAMERPETSAPGQAGNGSSPAATAAAPGKIVVEVDADLSDLIPDYLVHKRADSTALDAAIERSDFTAIGALGHRMKGDGGSYGFDPISEIGAHLMDAARRRDGSDARRLAYQFADYLARIEVVFKPENTGV
jgi:PAS domain S-box-containing protein